MKIGEEITWNWCNDGGGLIKRTEEGYALYEVPLYGGPERYYSTFTTLDGAKAQAEKWT